MADLIQWARTAQRTGLLKLRHENGKEIDVVFRDGRIVNSSTNDKRERWRGYLLHLGLCSEADIENAFQIRAKTGAMVASILVQSGKLTAEQAVSTLTEKTMEDLCDVFLWSEGSFAFDPTQTNANESMMIRLDPIHVVCEGIRRAEIWNRLNAYLHPSAFFERTEDPIDEQGRWEDIRMARRVGALLDGNICVGDVVESLPFSRYKIYRAISELLDHKFICAADITTVFGRDKRVTRKMADAQAASEAGRWTEAMEILQGLATANPGRADIVEQLLAVTRGFERDIYEHNFTKDDVPVVTIGLEALTSINIYPTEGFLLSRIDGRLKIRDILRISPVSEFEGLRSFKRLLSAKVIDFPRRTLRKGSDQMIEVPFMRA